MPEVTGRNDLRSYLRTLWRWKLLFLALLIAAPIATYFLERGKPKVYQSRALVGLVQLTIPSSVAGGSSFTTSNLAAIGQLVTTSQFADAAGRQMRPPISGSAIAGEVSASGDQTTGLLTITATDRNATRAAEIANAFATSLIAMQTRASGELNTKIRRVKTQIAHSKPSASNYQGLQAQLSQLQEQSQLQASGASVVQMAKPSSTPSGSSTRRSIELGLIIGLLLGVGAVVLAEGADRRFRSTDDLETATEFPLLAAIPPSAFSEELDTGQIDEEAFQMLRTSLTYFTGDRALRSVLIASPGEKEGKSTVAARLALAAAHAGLDVVLVDADLRRAGASAKFAISAQAGLGSVLSAAQPLESVMIDWPLENKDPGRLRIVPAGPPPANTSALISSEQMRRVLAQLEERSDLVVVDSPAALAVSDAVPLMRSVSGIVVVARINRSNRQTIARLQKMIQAAHGNVLGIVATGVTSAGYERYSRDYYGPVDHGRRGRRRAGRQSQAPPPKSSNGVPLTMPVSNGDRQHVESDPAHSPQGLAD